MKTIIAGSRGIVYKDLVMSLIDKVPWEISKIIHGGAAGVDTLAGTYAYHKKIPCAKYVADWEALGKSAGYVRNVRMAEDAEALLAIWDGKSKGTKHMIDIANKKGLRVQVVRVEIVWE